MGTILVLIFKNTSSKQQSKTLTLSHYALKKTGTLSLFIRIASVDNQLRMSGTVQMIWRILSPSVTLVSISTFSPKHKVLELTYNIYPDKKNHHSHYPRFNGFFIRGSSKLFLVKLETYRLKVDLTSSCHRLVQQAELCQFLVLRGSLNIFEKSKMSIKILHFRRTSASTICLFFFSNVALRQCFKVSKMAFSMIEVNSEIVNKTSHASYHMTDLFRGMELCWFYLLVSKLMDFFQIFMKQTKLSYFSARYFTQIEQIT